MTAKQTPDEIEKYYVDQIQRLRERAMDETRAMARRMTELHQRMEADGPDARAPGAHPSQQATALEETLAEWANAQAVLRGVRAMRKAAAE